MKHVFIINPTAGKKDVSNIITEKLLKYNSEIDYEIYITKHIGDAINFTRDYCNNYKEDVRFYSCGGDGTLNEIVNGVVGFNNATVACYPSGSGNDFIKVFGNKDQFLDLDDLINGQEIKVDILKINDRYTLNICNFGFDGVVADNMKKFRRWPLVKGKGVYNLALIYSILTRMNYECKITLDGNEIHNGKFLLCAIANGICYGGGYYCAPNAKVTDGLIDICLVKKVHRIKFINLAGIYKRGNHINNPKLKSIVTYVQGKKIEISSNKDLVYTLDGETDKTNNLSISLIEGGVRFIIPSKIDITTY